MLKELHELRMKLEQAVEEGDAERTLVLARRYLRLYRTCWPTQ